MTIASAIAALSPSLWYKLDEGGGTTAHNSGSLVNDGTASGSLDWTLPGPELGTTGLRVYTGGQVQSLAMDISSVRNITLALWYTCPADGSINVVRPIVNIGDPLNRLTRGPLIQESHAATGTPGLSGRWANSTAQSALALSNPQTWHYFALVIDTTGNVVRLYYDGQAQSALSLSGAVACQLTDPLLIKADESFGVAHVAFWNRGLAQTEIQTVSNQVGGWPYTVPINTPPSGGAGGGGGLTTDQAAQLSRVDTNTNSTSALQTGVNTLLSNWSGYTSVTLPSLQDALNAISGQVTGVQNTLNGWVTGLWTDVQNAIQNVLQNVQVTIPGPAGAVLDSLGHLFSPYSKDEIGNYNPYSGPTCDNIDYDLSYRAYFGCGVEITTRPLHFWPSTPDNDWTIGDMAVISFWIYENEIMRVPVHNTSVNVAPLPGTFPLRVADLGVPVTPGGYHIKVQWAPGVCGNFTLQYAPAVGPPGFPHFP